MLEAAPMASRFLIASLLLLCSAETCYGDVLFSSLKRTLVVSASPKQGAELRAGEDKITVKWVLNQSFPAGTDEAYTLVKVKLCYAPISQQDRAWRKSKDELSKDKTCQHQIVARAYDPSKNSVEQSFDWTIERDVPTATYFVRSYVYNSAGDEVGYGQTTDHKKTSNLFDIQGISGRHASLDIAAACFSAFSLVSLFGFFYVEKRKLRGGAAGSMVMELFGERMIGRDFKAGGFAEYMVKDLGMGLDGLEEKVVVLPGAALSKQLFLGMVANGDGKLGTQGLITVTERINAIAK